MSAPDETSEASPTVELGDRLARARERAEKAGVDALLITPGSDLRYLTGYRATALERLTCLAVPCTGEPVLVVPELEEPAALASPVADLGIDVLAWKETDDPYRLVASRIPRDHGRIALDDHMWARTVFKFYEAMPDGGVILAGPILEELRIRKTPAEIAALREAGAAIDRVHARMGEWLRAGRTEREVAKDIAEAILAEGHVTVDFTIVGSGPNGASPHHEVSDRVIGSGEPVVVDIGGTTAAGYCSDSTRTYIAGGGAAPSAFTALYGVLERAQAAACEHVRPGVTAESVDRAARDLIAAGGYGPRFIHRTGHGIGLETHEEPYLVAGNDRELEPGMAFSVEPGIYLPDLYGARIEDILVVTEDGGERLNLTSRSLTTLE